MSPMMATLYTTAKLDRSYRNAAVQNTIFEKSRQLEMPVCPPDHGKLPRTTPLGIIEFTVFGVCQLLPAAQPIPGAP